MRRPLPLFVLAASSLVAGCATLSQLASKAFKSPTVDFSRASVSDVSLSGATVDLAWLVENPNPIGIDIAKLDYLFKVEDKQVAAGAPKAGVTVAANKRGELAFPAEVKFADLASVITTFLQKDNASYAASGNVGFQTPLGILSFPLQHQGTFPVPKLPDVTFEAPSISKMDLTGATLEIPLIVNNKNGFPLPIDALVGGLNIAGAKVGQLNAGSMSLDAKATKRISLPIRVNFANALSAANAIRQGKATFAFDGQLKSGAVAVPLDFSKTLSFK